VGFCQPSAVARWVLLAQAEPRSRSQSPLTNTGLGRVRVDGLNTKD